MSHYGLKNPSMLASDENASLAYKKSKTLGATTANRSSYEYTESNNMQRFVEEENA